MHVDHWQ